MANRLPHPPRSHLGRRIPASWIRRGAHAALTEPCWSVMHARPLQRRRPNFGFRCFRRMQEPHSSRAAPKKKLAVRAEQPWPPGRHSKSVNPRSSVRARRGAELSLPNPTAPAPVRLCRAKEPPHPRPPGPPFCSNYPVPASCSALRLILEACLAALSPAATASHKRNRISVELGI
jgi:hypothetical protein